MASASGQKRGVCGHAMASFNPHEWCARCREKVTGSDPCVRGEEPCKYCVSLPRNKYLHFLFPNIKLEGKRRQKLAKIQIL